MAPTTNQITRDFTIARINLIPGAHAIVQRLRQGAPLILARDPADKYDTNAIMVIAAAPPAMKHKIGYLPLGLAKELAPLMDAGVNIIARKAPNPLYGVCQVAYIPPVSPVTVTDEPVAEVAPPVAAPPVTVTDEPVAEVKAPPVAAPPAIELEVPAVPEGVAQEDLDTTATKLPSRSVSRRLHQKDDDYD
jgi:hypothetical protein